MQSVVVITFDDVWYVRGVFFTESQFLTVVFRADGRQPVWFCLGERFAAVSVVNRVPQGGGGVMIWAVVFYGQRSQVHFIGGILNAQRHSDEAHCCAIHLRPSHAHFRVAFYCGKWNIHTV